MSTYYNTETQRYENYERAVMEQLNRMRATVGDQDLVVEEPSDEGPVEVEVSSPDNPTDGG